MLGSPILYLKGMRILMFQLSGFYYSLIIGFRVNPNSSNLQSNPTAPNTLVSFAGNCGNRKPLLRLRLSSPSPRNRLTTLSRISLTNTDSL